MTDRTPLITPTMLEPLEPRRHLAAGDFGSVTILGSGKIDGGFDLAFDPQGNLHITGVFQGKLDFDPDPKRKAILRTAGDAADDRDIFAAKYAPDGALLWARSFGGDREDFARHIAVGPGGNVFLAGLLNEQATFRTGDVEVDVRTRGEIDPFVAKLSPNGRLRWVGTIGGRESDNLGGLAVDDAGEVYVSGSIRLSGDLDPGPRNHRITTRGVDDSYISRLSGDDGSLVWSQVFGEADSLETDGDLAVDNDGHLFIAGSFVGDLDFARDRAESRFTLESDHYDGFFARLRTANGRFDYVQPLNADDDQTIDDLALGPDGSVYVTGTFEGEPDFDPSPAQLLLEAEGDQDVFVARYSRNGSLRWASAFGPDEDSDEDGELQPLSITVDPDGDVYTTGLIEEEAEIDFDPGPDEFIIISDKDNDAEPISDDLRQPTNAYFAKLSAGSGALRYAKLIGGEDGSVRANSIAIDPSTRELVAVGDFIDRADFDPGPDEEIRRTRDDEDDTDVFILRLLA